MSFHVTLTRLFQCNLLLFPRASSSRYLLMLCFSIIPLCPDPAISSVQHGFTRSLCHTVRGQYSQGKQHCAWTSCREGCTHEVYTCWQLEVSTSIRRRHDDAGAHFCEVEYNIYNENQTVADTRRGRLFPNVKGCGYPPIVECDGKKQHLDCDKSFS